jgi:hypothetical protein
MTEAEWLAGTEPEKMLAFLRVIRAQASERKLRLFACACCRRIWRLLSDDRSRKAVMTAPPKTATTAPFATLCELLDPSLVDGRGTLRGERYRSRVLSGPSSAKCPQATIPGASRRGITGTRLQARAAAGASTGT